MGSSGSTRGNSGGRRGQGGRSYSANLIPWLVISAGCMAIWPVTVPKPEQRRQEVVMLALPNVNSLNPGKKAKEGEVEVGLFDSGA